MRAETANRPGRVAVLALDGVGLFEFAVACRVFGPVEAGELAVPWYELVVCGDRSTVRSDEGVRLDVPRRLASLDTARTVIVPPVFDAGAVSDRVLAALRRAYGRGARIVSLCTGAFVLARAGLLDGRRAVTHWAECAALARAHPAVTVDDAVLHVQDGPIFTSAGSAASLDLCLHLVRLDLGAEIANRLARLLVVPPHRDGGQAQYVDTPVPVRGVGADPIATVLTWMGEHVDRELPIDELAHRAALSPRSFARHFVAATGTTPHQWLLRERTARAQRMLETTDLPVDAVAGRSGLGTAANLRKHFARHLATTPTAYRTTFRGRS